MIERGEQPRLTLEAREAVGVAREDPRQDLDRDVASQLRIVCAVHLAHERLGHTAERAAETETRREPQQPEEHLCGDERIASRSVPIVRDHAEHRAQRIEREVADRRAPGKGTAPLQMKRQVHGSRLRFSSFAPQCRWHAASKVAMS